MRVVCVCATQQNELDSTRDTQNGGIQICNDVVFDTYTVSKRPHLAGSSPPKLVQGSASSWHGSSSARSPSVKAAAETSSNIMNLRVYAACRVLFERAVKRGALC
jgi:hypothetical protein